MGVYIPKMKKPKCCGECLLCLDDSRIANGYCMIFHRHVNMTELDEKCPLIEIKTPHGRIIAESEITVVYGQTLETHFDGYTSRAYNLNYTDAPTVIESEE